VWEMFTKIYGIFILVICLVFAVGYVTSTEQVGQEKLTNKQQVTTTPSAPVNQPPAVVEPLPSPSKLGYGTVTSTVRKGVTTQAELVELFGSPNIATTDANGVETWVYERTATETNITNTQSVEAKGRKSIDSLASFFLVVGGGQSSESG